MRETDDPWRRGSGIQVRLPGRVVQVGVCDNGSVLDEIDGLVTVLDARMLDDPATTIRDWR
jgi:hypothetical protein